jgi:DNA mismatch repair ATPase MutS
MAKVVEWMDPSTVVAEKVGDGKETTARSGDGAGTVARSTFQSILFEAIKDGSVTETAEAPECFTDLNLDQVVDSVTVTKQEYNLKPFFYTALHDVKAIQYRHAIMQDLENPQLFEIIQAFAKQMRVMREALEQVTKLSYKYQKERWFLDAVEIYCDAINRLVNELAHLELKARGWLAFREYLTDYVRSARFVSLQAETRQVKADLSTVKYCVLIKGTTVKVRKYEEEPDYSAEVEETFAKFKQGAVKDYRVKFPTWNDMNHVEAQILDCVAQLYPQVFAALDNFCAKNAKYLDDTVARFDREVEFYIAYLEYIALMKRAGLQFCYPQVSDTCKAVHANQAFDLALAYKLVSSDSSIVCNDFYLQDQERILVVTGPNQGGKTTFARMFGQLHYLASLGVPVPGKDAQLFLYDQLLTHFECEEDIQNRRGKLEDDLVRIHDILNRATPQSLVILNEIFTSTTLQDALFLSKEILARLAELDALCVCVTFLDELATFNDKTVSMTSEVVPENPTARTFKIKRKPADGLAYALALAAKYRLTYDRLKERLQG